MPRYLRYQISPGSLAGPEAHAAEAEAEGFASGITKIPPARSSGFAERTLTQAIVRSASAGLGAGSPLTRACREEFEARLGIDLADVRLHTDAAAGGISDAAGASAYTLGRDIYFGRGRYQPGTADGDHLIAHEMAHVAQHGAGDGEQLHASLAPGNLQRSLPSTLGVFEIEFAQRLAPNAPGKEGHIRFDPSPDGPYSAEIGLIQSARTDSNGVTSNAKQGVSGGITADQVSTTGSQGEQAGWSIDVPYSDSNPGEGSQMSPSYPESWGLGDENRHGFLRSPTDHAPASLYDYPRSGTALMKFDFETVARGMDNAKVYGGLHWGFEIIGHTPQNEYSFVEGNTSVEFDNAHQRLRAFFTHEPTTIYFDTNLDVPSAGEEAKLDEAMNWLKQFPDAQVQIEGYADEQGPPGYNFSLSEKRAGSVAVRLIRLGLRKEQIDWSAGIGATASFAEGHQSGRLQANRRALIRFIRNARTPPAP